MYKYGWTGRDRAAGIETHENKKVKNENGRLPIVCAWCFAAWRRRKEGDAGGRHQLGSGSPQDAPQMGKQLQGGIDAQDQKGKPLPVRRAEIG